MTADLHAYRAVLARRWAVIVPAVVLVPILTLLLAVRQPKVYSANAQVLLTYTNVGASVNGLAPAYPATAPDRNVATQAALARNPAVARQALNLSHVRSSATDLLNESSVTSSSGADLLDFSVDASSPSRAMTLATNYARAYTLYRGRIDSQAISSSLAGINRRLSVLASSGQASTAAYRVLSRDQQELAAIQAAGTNDTVLSQPAQNATQTGPHPARSAALGLGVGIALAIALAFLMETVDKRAPVEEIERRLNLANLAAIPGASRWKPAVQKLSRLRAAIRQERGVEPRAALRAPGSDPPAVQSGGVSSPRRRVHVASGNRVKEVMLPPVQAQAGQRGAPSLAVVRDPYGRTAEAYRVLKSSLEFARLEYDFKSLLLTSPRQYRGKSETVANLAVTLAQSGRRVLLCDLNAGRASISDLFCLEERAGMTEVAMGRATLEEAIVSIPVPSLLPPGHIDRGDPADGGAPRRNGSSRGYESRQGLSVLPFGGLPPHSGFLGTRAVAELVEELRYAHADLVLIDAPSLLASGEAQTLSAVADALVVAVVDPVRSSMLADLAATLSRLPALPLGFVSVGVGRESGERSDEGTGGGGDPTPGDLKQLPLSSSGHNGHLTVPNGFTRNRS